MPDYSNEFFAGSIALVVLVIGTFAARQVKKNSFDRFFLELKWLRFIHYLAMFGWGFVRAESGYPLLLNQTTLLTIPLVTAGIFWAMLYLVSIERISRGEREPHGRRLFFAALSLFFAFLAGFEYAVLMGVFLGNFYLYYGPSWSLNRARLFSRIVLGLNSLLLITAGYLVREQDPRDFDPWIVAVIMVGATVYGFVELIWGRRRPQSHQRYALLAGHLASVAVMIVYQILHSNFVQERLQNLSSGLE